jgi:chitinase
MRPSEGGSPALTCPAGDSEAPNAIVLRLLDEFGFDGVRVASSLAAPDEQTRRQALKRL